MGNKDDLHDKFNLPVDEFIIEQTYSENSEQLVYITTKDQYRNHYFLYSIEKNKAKKINERNDPLFEETIKYFDNWRKQRDKKNKNKEIEESEKI